jgi:hypothetical protein
VEACHLVRGDTSSHAAAADQYAPIRAAVQNGPADCCGEVWIIHWFCAVGAEIENLVAPFAQVALQLLLEFEASVVSANRHYAG